MRPALSCTFPAAAATPEEDDGEEVDETGVEAKDIDLVMQQVRAGGRTGTTAPQQPELQQSRRLLHGSTGLLLQRSG
jgi:hypothetical protein